MYQIAQINIGKIVAPLESEELKEFVDNLDPVNHIAESSLGFVWRLKDESGDATSIQVFDDPEIIVNMSTWTDIESLKTFMFKTVHRDFLRRRKEWFELSKEATYCLWWIEEGYQPTAEEGVQRLMHLREHGPSVYAFDFGHIFQPD